MSGNESNLNTSKYTIVFGLYDKKDERPSVFKFDRLFNELSVVVCEADRRV